MFGPLGIPEILFILAIALLIFGPRRLPEMGRTLGKALGEFRRATTELKRSINTEIALEDDDERPRYARAPRPAASDEAGKGEAAGDAATTADAGGDEIQVTTGGLVMPGSVLPGSVARGTAAPGSQDEAGQAATADAGDDPEPSEPSEPSDSSTDPIR